MFKGKPVKVLITGDAKEEFEKLNKIMKRNLVTEKSDINQNIIKLP